MADTSSLPVFQTDVKHSPTVGHASPVFTTSVFQKTSDTVLPGLGAPPVAATASSDNSVKKDQEPVSAPSAANGPASGISNGVTNGAANGTANGTTNGDSHTAEATSSIPVPLPLAEEPKTAPIGISANTPSSIPSEAVVDPALGAPATGEKRKAEDEKEENHGIEKDISSGSPAPASASIFGNDGGEPAAKKAKTDAEAVSSGHSAPDAEVGLVSAPAPAETPAKAPSKAPATAPSDGDAGAKKSTKRTKREKKVPAVGKTARKTRSQGPVDA